MSAAYLTGPAELSEWRWCSTIVGAGSSSSGDQFAVLADISKQPRGTLPNKLARIALQRLDCYLSER